LAIAALADFSAVALVAVATSQDFAKLRGQLQGTLCEHWPSPKHLQHGKWKRKSNKETEKDTGRKCKTGKKITLRSSSNFQKFDAFRAQRDEFFHQNLSKERHE
jgi:hypothetical protein